jgi:hypothetical protein
MVIQTSIADEHIRKAACLNKSFFTSCVADLLAPAPAAMDRGGEAPFGTYRSPKASSERNSEIEEKHSKLRRNDGKICINQKGNYNWKQVRRF